MRIAVREIGQSSISRHVSKTVAQLFVRRLLAEWVSRSVIQMLAVKPPHKAGDPSPRYVPEKMPPLNVPGVWFEEPQSLTWKLQHRTAWQSYPQT
jgi:hypothetical protein